MENNSKYIFNETTLELDISENGKSKDEAITEGRAYLLGLIRACKTAIQERENEINDLKTEVIKFHALKDKLWI